MGNSLPALMNAASRVDFDDATSSSSSSSDSAMGFGERALSAGGAAVVSAILVNPLDVAKTRLQAQAAGVLHNDSQYLFGRHMASIGPNMEGLARLWRGTNAGLALAVPTVGIHLPCYDIFRNWIEEFTSSSYDTICPISGRISLMVISLYGLFSH